jgi:hypothetical protein
MTFWDPAHRITRSIHPWWYELHPNARDALSATAHARRQAELSVKVTTVRSEVSS